jgi:TatD DNase family protein
MHTAPGAQALASSGAMLAVPSLPVPTSDVPLAWLDSHCHLDAAEFAPDRAAVRQQAAALGVRLCVLPGVHAPNWAMVRDLAHQHGDAYALGIHPLYVPNIDTPALKVQAELAALDAALQAHRADPRLVAVGEIGLDFFVPALCTPAMRQRQEQVYRAQLQLAARHGLPVILHVRRSADRLLKHLREVGGAGGIAHAFNGSAQQAQAFVDLGFALGFGGAVTFDRALQLRRLAVALPLSALVVETDAPDIAPHWLYRTAQARADGSPQGRNSPVQLPRIGAELAALRGISPQVLAAATTANALRVLPRLQALWPALGDASNKNHALTP